MPKDRKARSQTEDQLESIEYQAEEIHISADHIDIDLVATNTKLDTLHADNVTTQGKIDTVNTNLGTLHTDLGTIDTDVKAVNTKQTDGTQKSRILDGSGNGITSHDEGAGIRSLDVKMTSGSATIDGAVQVKDASGNLINPAKEDGNLASIKAKTDNLDVALSTKAKDSTLTDGTQKCKTLDGSGNAITSKDEGSSVRSIDANIRSGTVGLATDTAVKIKDSSGTVINPAKEDGNLADIKSQQTSGSQKTQITDGATTLAMTLKNSAKVSPFGTLGRKDDNLSWVATEGNAAKGKTIDMLTKAGHIEQVILIRSATGGTSHTHIKIELYCATGKTQDTLVYSFEMDIPAGADVSIINEIMLQAIPFYNMDAPQTTNLYVVLTPSGGDATTTGTYKFAFLYRPDYMTGEL